MRPIRVLFVVPYVPSLLRPRPFNLLKSLSRRGHQISLLAIATSEQEQRRADAISPFCSAVRIVRVRPARSAWNCLRAAATGVPLQALFSYSPVARRFIREAIGGRAMSDSARFDILHVEHLRAAALGLSVRGIPRVFDSVDCITRLLVEAASHGSAPLTRVIARLDLPRTRRFERRVAQGFDQVLVSSNAERRHLERLLGPGDAARVAASRLQTLSNGVDLEYFEPGSEPRDSREIVFVGRMGYHANAAAAHYLLAQIMPRLWEKRPDVSLTIVGEEPPPSLRALATRLGPRVRVTGGVDDVRPYLARAALSVSPLVYAAGIQNKVLEAMAMETPVVATPVACAALEARDGEHLLVARDAVEFATSVDRLIGDPDLRRRVGAAGRAYVSSQHDWDAVARRLELLYWDQMRERGAQAR